MMEIHQDETKVLQAHEAIQWLAHRVDQRLRTAFLWCTTFFSAWRFDIPPG